MAKASEQVKADLGEFKSEFLAEQSAKLSRNNQQCEQKMQEIANKVIEFVKESHLLAAPNPQVKLKLSNDQRFK